MATSSDFTVWERMGRRHSPFPSRARGCESLLITSLSCLHTALFIALCLLSPASNQDPGGQCCLAGPVDLCDRPAISESQLTSSRFPFRGAYSATSFSKMAAYERQDSNGWADQWDKHFDEGGPQGGRKRSKMAKVKAAATNSVERTMSAATVSAQKVKSGTSTSLRWIKDKVQRKR